MINIQKATFSGLQRFAECVDIVMRADNLTDQERVNLITIWAYRADEPQTPASLAEEIKRCQESSDPPPDEDPVSNHPS